MPLATKNNAIILKDGKLAENCGCCGGWYCCAAIAGCPELLKITATIAASDSSGTWLYSNGRCYNQFGVKVSESPISKAAQRILNAGILSGTHDLVLQGGGANGMATYRKDFQSDGAGCGGAFVYVTTFQNGDFQCVLNANEYHWQEQVLSATPPQLKELADMKCGTEGSGGQSDNCSASYLFSRRSNNAVVLSGKIDNFLCLPDGSPPVATLTATLNVSAVFFEYPAADAFQTSVRDGVVSRSSSQNNVVTVQLAFSRQ